VPVQEGLLVREMTHGMHLSRYTEASTVGIDLTV
jgi:hypothetical protein